MDFRTLRALIAVVREGGFSQAAAVLNTTQSNVSKTIKQLEADVGMPLLERIGHRSILTDAGQIMYSRGLRLLADREDLNRELSELRGMKQGTLRLGIPPIGSTQLFAPLFAAYSSRYPGVEIKLIEHGCIELAELLQAGDIDLGALLLPLDDAFDWQIVKEEPLVAIAPRNHPLGTLPCVSLADLATEPLILYSEGFQLNSIITDAFSEARLTPRILARSSQIDFIYSLVSSGLGIGFLPRMIANRQAKTTRVLRLQRNLPWRMSLAWRRGTYLPQAAQAWLRLVSEHYSQDLPGSNT